MLIKFNVTSRQKNTNIQM